MSGVGGHLRLPSPPEKYEQGYMARLTNTLELDKQMTYFAADSALNNVFERAEATAWFISQMANNYKNAKLDLTSTDATVLYTCPNATTGIVKSILASEDSGTADTITVTITDSAAAVFSLFKVTAVAANTTVELLSSPLVGQENEILKVTAATANRLHVVASLLEVS